MEIARREDIFALEAAIAELPGSVKGNIIAEAEGLDVTHHFANGVYCREMNFPADSMLVGHIHRYPTNNILLTGRIVLVNPVDGGEPTEFVAPCVWQSPAGSKRAAIALEDSRWITTHPVDPEYTEDDMEKIAAETIVNSYEELT